MNGKLKIYFTNFHRIINFTKFTIKTLHLLKISNLRCTIYKNLFKNTITNIGYRINIK
jgi:hypothetical protein